jgi:hypothetical protein
MPYLLDANTLIQAKNEYYAFDICPGFWEWLDIANASGDVSSIEPVADELRKGRTTSRRGQPRDAERSFSPSTLRRMRR